MSENKNSTMKEGVKRCAAYLRNERIYLHPDSETIKGRWTATEPIVVTSEKGQSLGEKVLRTLASSAENIPDPDTRDTSDISDPIRALVQVAGVHSYEAFCDTTRCVNIKLATAEVEFTPTLNGGYRRRFLNLRKTIRSRPIEAEVAAALLAAFEACET
jgi:hypothetical protein